MGRYLREAKAAVASPRDLKEIRLHIPKMVYAHFLAKAYLADELMGEYLTNRVLEIYEQQVTEISKRKPK